MITEDSFKNYFDKLTLGLIQALEKKKGVCDIRVSEKPPVDKLAIAAWEQKHSCMMPDDLKKFYMTSNGFLLSWNVKMDDNHIPVGHMEVNSLESLNRLAGINQHKTTGTEQESKKPTLLDIEDSDEEEGIDDGVPKFDHRSRIFELDGCQGFGKVCYVFRNTKPGIPAQRAEVWFLDRSLRWHFMTDCFLNYYRMMLTHLGLPQWQYTFTDIGISIQAKQWYYMYCPTRLDDDDDLSQFSPDMSGDQPAQVPLNQLDPSRVFMGKSDKKKTTQNPTQFNKKRQGMTSARTMGSGQGRGGSANQQSRTMRP